MRQTRLPGFPPKSRIAARPAGAFPFDRLAPEAREYLERSGACLPTPIERLKKMNPPAIDLFRSHGIDLEREPLEIEVCAQHNNGGLAGNIWWESGIAHLFPVGEVNGTHGVYRPGGSALNSGQVGSARAARFIARNYAEAPPGAEAFARTAEARVIEIRNRAERMISGGKRPSLSPERALREIRARMSAHGAQIRDPKTIEKARTEAWALHRRCLEALAVPAADALPDAFRALDHALTVRHVPGSDQRISETRGAEPRVLSCPRSRRRTAASPDLGPEWAFSLASPDDFAERQNPGDQAG